MHGEANTRTLYRAEEVALATNEGTNYWVRVTGDSTQSGEFLLDWDEAPANDDFSNPQVITEIEVEGSVAGSNEFATLQPGRTDNDQRMVFRELRMVFMGSSGKPEPLAFD